MGAPDAAAKEFFSQKQIFADIFNIGVFGEQIIDPNKLEQVNPNLAVSLFKAGGNRVLKEIERTLDDARIAEIMMRDDQASYLVLGTQYEMTVHPALPLRNLLETALLYTRQAQEIIAANRKKDAAVRKARQEYPGSDLESPDRLFLDSGQFLSGFTLEDKLHPVITAVLYLGNTPWKGARSLRELLDTTDEYILRYMSCDSKVNLILPEDIPDRPEHRASQFWRLMRILTAGHMGKQNLLDLTRHSEFSMLPSEMVRLVNTLLRTNIKLNPNEGGIIDMCKAMQEITEEITGYQNKITGYQAEISSYQNKIDGYQAEISDYQKEMARQALEIAELKAKLGMKI